MKEKLLNPSFYSIQLERKLKSFYLRKWKVTITTKDSIKSKVSELTTMMKYEALMK
jgi:hypothetical protein